MRNSRVMTDEVIDVIVSLAKYGYNDKQLAEKCGVKYGTLTQYFNDARRDIEAGHTPETSEKVDFLERVKDARKSTVNLVLAQVTKQALQDGEMVDGEIEETENADGRVIRKRKKKVRLEGCRKSQEMILRRAGELETKVTHTHINQAAPIEAEIDEEEWEKRYAASTIDTKTE